jgi:tRNA (Thr-GGU) A37 N-methylase
VREESRYEHRVRPIGFVRTDAPELPRHWSVSDVEGTLVIDEEYSQGLRGIEVGQRIVVILPLPSERKILLRVAPANIGPRPAGRRACSIPARP